MKSRATLSLIEQIIMIAFFAIAAAISLRVFVYADSLSREKEMNDFAVGEVQNAAELIKCTSGDVAAVGEMLGAQEIPEGFVLNYDRNLKPAEEGGYCSLKVVRADGGSGLLGAAEVHFTGPEKELFAVTVYWQEEAE